MVGRDVTVQGDGSLPARQAGGVILAVDTTMHFEERREVHGGEMGMDDSGRYVSLSVYIIHMTSWYSTS